MDEHEIAMHQFFGYIVNHVPEYRNEYRVLLSVDEAGTTEMLEGFSGFLISAWKDREDRPVATYPGDTFARLVEATEMGLRSQEESVAELIVAQLQSRVERDELDSELLAQLGVCTKQLLSKRHNG